MADDITYGANTPAASGAVPLNTPVRSTVSTEAGHTGKHIQHVKLDTGDGTNTQPVSGTVTANTGLTQPLTDTQLRAVAVPVSGTVTANTGLTPLTDTQLRAVAVPVSGTVTANTGLDPLTDTQLRATAVPVTDAALADGTQKAQLCDSTGDALNTGWDAITDQRSLGVTFYDNSVGPTGNGVRLVDAGGSNYGAAYIPALEQNVLGVALCDPTDGLTGNTIKAAKVPLTGSAPTAVSVGVTSAEAVAANANRKGLILTNTSVNWISIAFGAAAVLYSGITLSPMGGQFEMDEYAYSQEQVRAIASGAASNLGIQEFV